VREQNRRRSRVVVDALQVSPDFSGVGRELLRLGADLSTIDCPLELEVRCSKVMEESLRAAFPARTAFHTPLRRARPRMRRVLYQQLVAPLRDRRSTILLCPGDQAPVWGRAPLIFVINDIRRLTEPGSGGSRLERAYYRASVKRGARRAAAVLTISEFSRDEIERTLAPPRPVDVMAIHPRREQRPVRRPETSKRLLLLGALRPYKGIETVVDALALLRASGEAVPEVISVGSSEGQDGFAERLAERAERAGVADHLVFRGWLGQAELDALCETLAGTINPSTYEGYGLPVAESLARGLPTIASDIPPHREIAREAALFFPPGDAHELARAMAAVVGDRPEQDRLARAAYERAGEMGAGYPSLGEAVAGAAAKLID
jgi:glycosyltransferase involved in cell wall biosynthesis